MNQIMSAQLCERCHVEEAAPGNSFCYNCMPGASNDTWVPTHQTLADLDQLEDRHVEPWTGIVPRLLWWVGFAVIALLIVLLVVDKTHIPFIDNIPGVAELRGNMQAASDWWESGIHKLGDSMGF